MSSVMIIVAALVILSYSLYRYSPTFRGYFKKELGKGEAAVEAQAKNLESWGREEALKVTADLSRVYGNAQKEIMTEAMSFYTNGLKKDALVFEAKVDALIEKLRADVKAVIAKA